MIVNFSVKLGNYEQMTKNYKLLSKLMLDFSCAAGVR